MKLLFSRQNFFCSIAFFITFIFIMAAVILAASGGMKLVINGKIASKAAIIKDDEVYIPVSALKEAGVDAQIRDNEISIRFLPVFGGSNQADAIEGKTGEMLFNSIWRVRATNITPFTDPYDKSRPGFKITIECRNGSNKTVSQFNTGMKYPELFDKNNTKLTIDENDWQTGSWFKELPPGGSVVHDAIFYYPHNTSMSSVNKPAKLLIQVDPKDGNLKSVGLKYLVKSPSFRIFLLK